MDTQGEIITMMLTPQKNGQPNHERKTTEQERVDSEFADRLVDDFRITPLEK